MILIEDKLLDVKLMTQFKLNFKFVTSSILATSTILTSLLLPAVSYANEDDTELKKTCNRQSLITVAKIKNSSSNEMTEQDIRMLRLGAIHACMEVHKRLVNSSEPIKSIPSDEKVATKTDDTKNQESNSDKSESIFDRLLSTKKREDLNPMQKKHRTGGK